LLRTGALQASFDPGALTQDRTMNEPMPRSLQVTTWFKVMDSSGHLLRSEQVPAGTDLADRLRLAHRNYQLQGWTVDPLLPGRWSFIAEKSGQRLLIGIRHCVPQSSRRFATANTTDSRTGSESAALD
jgi:hypothetical protein